MKASQLKEAAELVDRHGALTRALKMGLEEIRVEFYDKGSHSSRIRRSHVAGDLFAKLKPLIIRHYELQLAALERRAAQLGVRLGQ